ncbi:MAG: nucleotidyltransferase family protein [Acidimicrobiales bacterium]
MAGVLLAAGGGQRFKGPTNKLMAPFAGRPLVAWALESVCAADLDEVVVVAGAVDLAHLMPPEVTLIDNALWAQGQATSLRVALEWCAQQGHDAAVVGLGDQPGVTTAAWSALAHPEPERAGANGPRTSLIVVATYAGRRGNPVRLDRGAWPLVHGFGDEGARRLMRERPELVSELACEGNPRDIDTVEDLQAWN